MIVKKLILTKKSNYFHKVKKMTNSGIYIVEGDSGFVSFWKDGVELMTYEDFYDAIEFARLAWSRDKKLNKILK